MLLKIEDVNGEKPCPGEERSGKIPQLAGTEIIPSIAAKKVVLLKTEDGNQTQPTPALISSPSLTEERSGQIPFKLGGPETIPPIVARKVVLLKTEDSNEIKSTPALITCPSLSEEQSGQIPLKLAGTEVMPSTVEIKVESLNTEDGNDEKPSESTSGLISSPSLREEWHGQLPLKVARQSSQSPIIQEKDVRESIYEKNCDLDRTESGRDRERERNY